MSGLAVVSACQWPQQHDGQLLVLACGIPGATPAPKHTDPQAESLHSAQRAPVKLLTIDAAVVGTGSGRCQVERMATAAESEAAVRCAAASPCGRLWAAGTADGGLLCYNAEGRRLERSEQLPAGAQAVALAFSGPILMASLSTAVLQVYDWGTNVLRVVVQGAAPPSASLRVQDVLDTTAPAPCIHGCAARPGIFAVAAATGPAALLHMSGAGSPFDVAAAHARATRSAGLQEAQRHPAVRFVAQAPRADRLHLVSAASAAAYAARDAPLLDALLHAFAPAYRNSSEQAAFAGIFRRHFDAAVLGGFFERAYAAADCLGMPALFDDLYAVSQARLAPALRQLTLSRASAATRDAAQQRSALQHWAKFSDGDEGAAVERVLEALRGGDVEKVTMRDAARAVHLLALYRGRAAAAAAAERFAQRARADGDEEGAAALLSEVPPDPAEVAGQRP